MVQKGRPLPQPECGFLFNTWKWIIQGDACADKARDFIGKGCLGREQQREPRRIALPCGLQSWVLWWWDSFPGCLWPITSSGCYLCFWQTGYRSEVPTTPFLGSIDLLEQLTELRRIVYSLLGETYWLKSPTLARHYLCELFYDRKSWYRSTD